MADRPSYLETAKLSFYWISESTKLNKTQPESERLVFSFVLYVILSTSALTEQIIQNLLILISNFWTAAITCTRVKGHSPSMKGTLLSVSALSIGKYS